MVFVVLAKEYCYIPHINRIISSNSLIMKNFQQNSIAADTKNLALNPPSVTQYMTTKLITFKPDTLVSEVIKSLLTNRITGAPVINDKGQVVGMIDDKDCLNVLISGAYNNHPTARDTVDNYMSNVFKSINVESNIVEVADIFLHSKYKRLLVMDDEHKLLGQISRRDILRAIGDMNANTW